MHRTRRQHSLYVCDARCVRLPEAALDDARVPALAVPVPQRHAGEQLVQLAVGAHNALRLRVRLRRALRATKGGVVVSCEALLLLPLLLPCCPCWYCCTSSMLPHTRTRTRFPSVMTRSAYRCRACAFGSVVQMRSCCSSCVTMVLRAWQGTGCVSALACA